jgi:Ca-activated chloride channel family protein
MDTADFHFEKPALLTVAVLAGLLVFGLLRWTERRRRLGLAEFAAERLLGRLTAGYSAARRRTKDAVLAVALALLVAALAGPRWGVEISQQRGATEDVVFALDVSKSMLVADMSPTRLARAKAAIANFVKRKGTGNVGLVAFAGQAFLQCPLTRDYDAFFRTLEETDTGSIQVPGTDIGRAIEEAELAFYSNRNRKLLILLTDGEDLEAGGVDTAKKLKRKGLVIHAVGVGTPAGGPIRVISPLGAVDTLKDSSGEEVRSRLDEKTLGELAGSTGGRFIRLGQAGEGMEALRLAIEAGTDENGAGRRGIPREEWLVGAALLLLVIESLTSTRRRRTET